MFLNFFVQVAIIKYISRLLTHICFSYKYSNVCLKAFSIQIISEIESHCQLWGCIYAATQRLHKNCWRVKVESCGCCVLRSYDSRSSWLGGLFFPPLRWLTISHEHSLQTITRQLCSFYLEQHSLKISLRWKYIIASLCFQYSARFFFLPPPTFFSGYHSISKTKSVLIGSRGLMEALCQRWWGSWLVQGHRSQQILVSVSGGLCLLVSPMNSFADGGWHGLVYQCGTKDGEGWGGGVVEICVKG